MDQAKESRKKKFIAIAVAGILLLIGGFSMWSSYTRYYPSGQSPEIPEAGADSDLPANPRDHVIQVMEELDLSTGQWMALARLGPPEGTMEEREAHAARIAAILTEEQLARFSQEMRELHFAILDHMMSRMTREDREEFLKRLERNPDYSPGPPRALRMGTQKN